VSLSLGLLTTWLPKVGDPRKSIKKNAMIFYNINLKSVITLLLLSAVGYTDQFWYGMGGNYMRV
jgi:hypothetical protein